MKKTSLVAACLVPIAGACSAADAPPAATISNRLIRARVYLPDVQAGFYRGTRFDWSGVIGGLEYAGHEFYPPWFQRMEPKVHDFVYEGADIVAGPCTAMTGPAEEFVKALGFEEAKAGGTFIKVGVGVLHKPDNQPYDMFHRYEIVDPGKWTTRNRADGISFQQVLSDPASGFGYDYRKTVSLAKDSATLVLDHELRNTGTRALQTPVYNHNFLYLDREAPGPDISMTVPFKIQASPLPDQSLASVRENGIRFAKTLSGEDRVYCAIAGFGAEPKDYDIRIENRKLGVGLRITSDRPLSRAALWAIRAPLSIEPFIDVSIEPGSRFTWRTEYQYYTLPGAEKPK